MPSTGPIPRISVVIPTHKRPDLLERLLRSLSDQTLEQDLFEVIVTDDASGDSTNSLLETARACTPNLRWSSFDQGRGPAAARNRGVELSRGNIILFLDDDVEADRDLLALHLALHDRGDPNLGILGRVDWHPALEVTPFMKWLDSSGLQFAYDTWLSPGPVDPPYGAFYTANLSLRRDLIESAGGFDERFPFPAYEDIELAWRLWKLGFRMNYHPEARVYHTRSIDLATFRRRMARVAESAVLLGAVQPDFPLDASHTPERWAVPQRLRRVRIALAARLAPTDERLGRRYRAEIASAYQDGLRLGQARVRPGTETRTPDIPRA